MIEMVTVDNWGIRAFGLEYDDVKIDLPLAFVRDTWWRRSIPLPRGGAGRWWQWR